jgi:hypothetical protein
MRCALRSISRIAGDVLKITLILAASPVAGAAQSFVCHPLRAGESAAQVARRITGQSRNTGQAWFQIMNASSKFVPKSQYDRVRTGWKACIPETAVERASSASDQVRSIELLDAFQAPDAPGAEALATRTALVRANDTPQSAEPGFIRTIGARDLTIVWLGAVMAVSWAGWRVFDGYSARRKTATIVMKHFAARFVHEFERPLIRYDAAERAVRSGLRRTRRGRFDILLAPGNGRRYPNLSDHKKNVEYDVARVMRLLADESFVSGPVYTQAGWVVVPFQTKAGRKPAGVTCVSSF